MELLGGSMKRYVLRRLVYGVITVWILSIIIFVASRLGPDPVLMMTDPMASESDLQRLREDFSLDKSWPVQYFVFISKALKGDFGESVYYGVPVTDVVLDAALPTVQLIVAGMIFSLVVGLGAGVIAAKSHKKWVTFAVRMFSYLGLSIPNFWFSMLLILVFSIWIGVLPISGSGGLKHLILPAIALGFHFCASYTRIIHSSLLEVLNQEYIKLARLKGLSETIVVGKHAFRNAVLPVLTIAGMRVVIMVSAAVAIEAVFAYPGLGHLMYQGATNRDFNTVQCVVLVLGVTMVLINLLVDILYAYVDPRIRYYA